MDDGADGEAGAAADNADEEPLPPFRHGRRGGRIVIVPPTATAACRPSRVPSDDQTPDRRDDDRRWRDDSQRLRRDDDRWRRDDDRRLRRRVGRRWTDV